MSRAKHFFSPLNSEIFSTYMRMKRCEITRRKYIFQLCILNNKFQCFYVSLKSLCTNIREKLKKTTRNRKLFLFRFSLFYIYFIAALLLCVFRVYLPRKHNSGSTKNVCSQKKPQQEILVSLLFEIEWNVFDKDSCCLVRKLNWIIQRYMWGIYTLMLQPLRTKENDKCW